MASLSCLWVVSYFTLIVMLPGVMVIIIPSVVWEISISITSFVCFVYCLSKLVQPSITSSGVPCNARASSISLYIARLLLVPNERLNRVHGVLFAGLRFIAVNSKAVTSVASVIDIISMLSVFLFCCYRVVFSPCIAALSFVACIGAVSIPLRRFTSESHRMVNAGLLPSLTGFLGCDLIVSGLMGFPFSCTRKSRCGPVDIPVEPT